MAGNSLNVPAPGEVHEWFLGSLSWTQILLACLVAYMTLCSYLRFQRINVTRKRFPYPDRASLSRMTNDHAQAIAKNIATLEFPYFYDLSQRYALFRVCAAAGFE